MISDALVHTAFLFPTLTSIEMQGLFQELFIVKQDGDEAAKAFTREKRDLLVSSNLRLVTSIVRRFIGSNEYADLFQEGCIGLMKAIDNFDLTRGLSFSTYAVPMIIGEIRRYIRDNRTIQVSRSLRDLAYKAMQTRDSLIACLKREPSAREITKELNKGLTEEIGISEKKVVISEKKVVFALAALQEPISLFETVYHDDEDPLFVMDQVRDKKGEERYHNTTREEKILQDLMINEAIEKLSEREQAVIKMRFFEGKTQIEAAHETGVSQAQISRREKSALEHLRKKLLE